MAYPIFSKTSSSKTSSANSSPNPDDSPNGSAQSNSNERELSPNNRFSHKKANKHKNKGKAKATKNMRERAKKEEEKEAKIREIFSPSKGAETSKSVECSPTTSESSGGRMDTPLPTPTPTPKLDQEAPNTPTPSGTPCQQAQAAPDTTTPASNAGQQPQTAPTTPTKTTASPACAESSTNPPPRGFKFSPEAAPFTIRRGNTTQRTSNTLFPPGPRPEFLCTHHQTFASTRGYMLSETQKTPFLSEHEAIEESKRLIEEAKQKEANAKAKTTTPKKEFKGHDMTMPDSRYRRREVAQPAPAVTGGRDSRVSSGPTPPRAGVGLGVGSVGPPQMGNLKERIVSSGAPALATGTSFYGGNGQYGSGGKAKERAPPESSILAGFYPTGQLKRDGSGSASITPAVTQTSFPPAHVQQNAVDGSQLPPRIEMARSGSATFQQARATPGGYVNHHPHGHLQPPPPPPQQLQYSYYPPPSYNGRQAGHLGGYAIACGPLGGMIYPEDPHYPVSRLGTPGVDTGFQQQARGIYPDRSFSGEPRFSIYNPTLTYAPPPTSMVSINDQGLNAYNAPPPVSMAPPNDPSQNSYNPPSAYAPPAASMAPPNGPALDALSPPQMYEGPSNDFGPFRNHLRKRQAVVSSQIVACSEAVNNTVPMSPPQMYEGPSTDFGPFRNHLRQGGNVVSSQIAVCAEPVNNTVPVVVCGSPYSPVELDNPQQPYGDHGNVNNQEANTFPPVGQAMSQPTQQEYSDGVYDPSGLWLPPNSVGGPCVVQSNPPAAYGECTTPKDQPVRRSSAPVHSSPFAFTDDNDNSNGSQPHTPVPAAPTTPDQPTSGIGYYDPSGLWRPGCPKENENDETEENNNKPEEEQTPDETIQNEDAPYVRPSSAIPWLPDITLPEHPHAPKLYRYRKRCDSAPLPETYSAEFFEWLHSRGCEEEVEDGGEQRDATSSESSSNPWVMREGDGVVVRGGNAYDRFEIGGYEVMVPRVEGGEGSVLVREMK